MQTNATDVLGKQQPAMRDGMKIEGKTLKRYAVKN